jgi:serpin B
VGVIQDDIGQTPRLRIVNAIWGQQGFPLLSSYLDTIALNFGAELRLADFRHAAEAARLIINAWAEEQTNQRIKDLLAKGSIDADTRVVLTNAVWFKANWASPFAAGQTRDRPFIDRSGMPKAVPFMSQTYWVPYGRSKACQAVDIPYTEGKISMMVIMPDVGTFDAFLTAFTPAVLDEIIGKLDTQYVALSMPKFTFSATPPIGSTLRTLGMAEAFDPFEADFSGIDGKRDLFIGNVVHQAFISVDEKGTEAAAATAVSLSTVSLPPPPLPLAVDHPFIFLIRDRETGLILFIGKVVAL